MEPNELKESINELTRAYEAAQAGDWAPITIVAIAMGVVLIVVTRMLLMTFKSVKERQEQTNLRIDKNDGRHEKQDLHNKDLLKILNELKIQNEIDRIKIERNEADIKQINEKIDGR
jgi:NADH:ubiquinone oxidoreductase subunit 5 (subunit L)/multisubunit Na+/H+ antiporter MnhA subunit